MKYIIQEVLTLRYEDPQGVDESSYSVGEIVQARLEDEYLSPCSPLTEEGEQVIITVTDENGQSESVLAYVKNGAVQSCPINSDKGAI